MAEARRGARHSEETRAKIAAAAAGRKHSEETKTKIAASMQALPPRGILHRLRISQGRQNVRHTEETREKISAAVRATKRRLQRERLAARAAQAAEAATADLRPAFTSSDDGADGDGGEGLLLDPIELEGAVIELTSLRRQLTAWMDAYEKKYGRKPDLTETSESHPMVYGRFARYVALRELVRRSSLAVGSTPVSWT